MERWLTLFLSMNLIIQTGCHPAGEISVSSKCKSRSFQDSLIRRYVDSGAEKLPYIYNNPVWGRYMDSVLAICPDVAEAYQLKAVPAIKNGEYTKAYQLDTKAAELDPAQYLSYLGFLKCIFTKDYSGAITDFKKAIQIVPGGGEMDHGFYFYLGICYLKLGNYPEASFNFNKDFSEQQHGDSTREIHYNALMYMGITKLESRDLDSARYWLLKSLRIYPELPEANYYVSVVYHIENRMDLEKKYLELAKKSIQDGYRMNEDNMYYVNYPYQITLYEVNQRLAERK
jgi:tetratricopeptide (TPR) repeat protein